jgi:hypothetical protein
LTITYELGARWRDADAVLLHAYARGCGQRRHLNELQDASAAGDDVVPLDDLLSLHPPIVQPLRTEHSLQQTQERLL